MNTQAIYCSSFTIERQYKAAPAAVFAAWSSAEAKARWFAGPDGWQQLERVQEFRPGGREVLKGRFPDGGTSFFDARYYEIVPNQLIVYVYDMWRNDTRLSVSLASIEFRAAAKGTQLVVTEQGVFYGDKGDAASREQGTGWLMDKMGAPFK